MKKGLEEIELEHEMMVTELIGLGEVKREIYEKIDPTGKLQDAYKLHQQELELLIKYRKEVIQSPK